MDKQRKIQTEVKGAEIEGEEKTRVNSGRGTPVLSFLGIRQILI